MRLVQISKQSNPISHYSTYLLTRPAPCFPSQSEQKLSSQSWFIRLFYLYHGSPQQSRSRLSPEGVAWDRSEVAGLIGNIFSSVLNISNPEPPALTARRIRLQPRRCGSAFPQDGSNQPGPRAHRNQRGTPHEEEEEKEE